MSALSHPVADHADTAALRVEGLTCAYDGEAGPVQALRGVDLELGTGSFTAIMGPSGSGKTTLLNCAAGLQRPSEGSISLAGTVLEGQDETALTMFRRRHLGFVFQDFNLLPALTAMENVELPLRLDGRATNYGEIMRLLTRVGLAGRAGHRPGKLSGGQQQRVAVARALVTRPDIVFADEPTGALDLHSARQVLRLLRALADGGQTIVMVTHDPTAAARADQVLFLADGRLVDRLTDSTAPAVAERMTALVEQAERAANGMEER